MQINFTPTHANAQFGMAFKTSNNVDMMKLYNYAKLDNNINRRGYRQLEKEQSKLQYCDLYFNGQNNMVSLLDKKNNKFIQMYLDPASKYGKYTKKQIHFPGRKLLATLFNPKKLLPENIYQAGEDAKKLDKQLRKTK